MHTVHVAPTRRAYVHPDHPAEQGPLSQQDSALHAAIREGRLDAIRDALQSDPELLRERDADGNGPLHIAIQANASAAVVEELLWAGADTELRNGQGMTPLHQAAAMNQRELVKALLDGNADTRASTPQGRNPIQLCQDPDTQRQIAEYRVLGPFTARLRQYGPGPISLLLFAVNEARRARWCTML